jgi:proteasome accessory factor B
MSEKVERVFNVIALLLNARRPVSASEIRAKIPGYDDRSEVAFHRMFERDKAEIRELGYTLEQQETGDGEAGYRVAKEEALLTDPGFTPDEMAALSLAAQAWSGQADGSLALLKLSVGAGIAEPGASGWRPPRVDVDDRVSDLLDAIARRKRVRFTYRTAGAGEPHARDVEPYGLHHRGAWYLTGRDRARDGERHFRLSRIEGAVEIAAGDDADFEPPESVGEVRRGPWEGEATLDARVAFAPDTAFWVERRTHAERVAERDDGWIEFSMPVPDVDRFAGWLAGFADSAVALSPPELRDAVVAHLAPLGEDA